MICPLEGHECQCDEDKATSLRPECTKSAPPKPTMAEIERLVDAVKIACVQYGRSGGADTIMESACAALLAAIRAYGEGK